MEDAQQNPKGRRGKTNHSLHSCDHKPMMGSINIGPKWGSYLEFYKVIPTRNYFGAYG